MVTTKRNHAKSKKTFFQKKAFIFTFMSFFFVASVFIYVQTQQLDKETAQVDAEVFRVERISSYVTNLEEDYLPLLAKITATNAIRNIVNESLTDMVSVGSDHDFGDAVYRRVTTGTKEDNSYFTDFSNKPLSDWNHFYWGVKPRSEVPCLVFEAGCVNIQTTYFEMGSYIPLLGDIAITDCSFFEIRDNYFDYSGTYYLENNIDCLGYDINPIGDYLNPFTGTFDGNGFVIGNLSISRASDNLGLFGVTDSGAQIRNVGLVASNNGRLVYGNSRIGALIGSAKNTVVKNVFARGDIETFSFYGVTGVIYGKVGGLIGFASETQLEEVYFDGNILGTHAFRVGGLLGEGSQSSVRNAFVRGFVTADSVVGSVVGDVVTTDIRSIFTLVNLADGDTLDTLRIADASEAFGNGDSTTNIHDFYYAPLGGADTTCDPDILDSCGEGEVAFYQEVNPLSLKNLVDKMNSATQEVLEIPFDLDYTSDFFNITQVSPWTLRATILFTFDVDDTSVSWKNVHKLVEVDIPIDGFVDPFLLFNGISLVPPAAGSAPTITRSQIEDGAWNVSALRDHLQKVDSNGGYVYTYVANPDAPSYLDRLQNKTTPSEFGIELVMAPYRFGIETGDVAKPYVDYQFVQDWDCVAEPLYEITEIANTVGGDFNGFKFDKTHTLTYLSEAEWRAFENDGLTPIHHEIVCP